MQAQTPGRGTWSGRIRQLGKGTEKEHAGEGDRKHDWEEESEKASWRRGHPSFLLKDGAFGHQNKGSLDRHSG